jgi:hypothetical protein
MTNNFGSDIEFHLNNKYVFTVLVLVQALFGSYGLVDTPVRIQNLYKHQIFRLFLLFTIAYTATNQIEISALGISSLLIFIHLLRTPEERENHKFI